MLDKHFVYVMLLFVSKICSDFCLPLAGGLQKTAIQLLRYSQVRNFGGKMCLFDYHKHVLHFNHRYFQKFNHNCVQIAPLDLSQKTFYIFLITDKLIILLFQRRHPVVIYLSRQSKSAIETLKHCVKSVQTSKRTLKCETIFGN